MAGKKGAIHRPASKRWAEKIRVETDGLGCWIWTAATDAKGYGLFRVEGRTWRAHRWGYTQIIGPISEGMELDHYCLNTSCVNPFHLEEVTSQENRRRKFLARTHCQNGHPYDDVRVDVDPETGWRHRYCRHCKRKWSRENRPSRAKAS